MRLEVLFLLAMIFASPVFGSALINATTTTSDTTFLTSPYGRSVCRTTNAVHAVWSDGTRVIYANSTDGTTWNKRQFEGGSLLGRTGDPPVMACSGNRVFIAWEGVGFGSSVNSIFYVNSSDEGLNWNTDLDPATVWLNGSASFTITKPSVHFGIGDNVYVAYLNDSGAPEMLYVSNSSVYGEDSPAPTIQAISGDWGSTITPAIFVNSSGATENIWIVTPERTSLYGLRFNYSMDSGATWSGSTVCSSTCGRSANIVLLNRSIWVAVHDDSNDMYVYNSTNGSGWTSTRIDTIGTGTSRANYPKLVADETNDNLYVFWQENDTSTGEFWDIKYRTWNSTGGWSSVVTWESLNSTTDVYPSAKWNASAGLIEVVWQNKTAASGNADIMYDFIDTSIAAADSVPTMSIDSPANTTYTTQNTTLNFRAGDDIGVDQCRYSLNNGANTTITNCANTTFLAAEGFNNIRIYVNDTTNQTANAQVNFTADTLKPVISFVSPTPNNETIDVSWVYINVSFDEKVTGAVLEWNGANETMTRGSDTLWFKNKTSLSPGTYTFRIYANDSANNTNASETRYADMSVQDGTAGRFEAVAKNVMLNLAFRIGASKSDDIVSAGENYAIAQDGNVILGILSGGKKLGAQFNRSYSSTENILRVNQASDGNRFFIVFTSATNQTITEKANLLVDNKIPSKTFGNLIASAPSSIFLFLRAEYDDADIITRTRWGASPVELIIKNNGDGERGPQISIELVK